MSIQIFEKKPADFVVRVEIAGVYVNVNGRILYLQCAPHKPEPGAWGVPAGKLEANESPDLGAARELWEETGIQASDLLSLGVLYLRKPGIDYAYHLFGVHFDSEPQVILSEEHTAYQWITREEAAEMPLMLGALFALDTYLKHVKELNGEQ